MAAGFRGLLHLIYRWLPGQQGANAPGCVDGLDLPVGRCIPSDFPSGLVTTRTEVCP